MCWYTELQFQCPHKRLRTDVDCHFTRAEKIFMSPQQRLNYKCPSRPLDIRGHITLSTECEQCRSTTVARIGSLHGELGVQKLHAIWAIESLIAKVLVVENEKSVWEKKESLEGGLDELDQGRFIKVKDESEKLGKQFDVPTLEAELKQLQGDLNLGKMEIPQALLERLQGLQNVPDTDIVNTNTMETG
jgi:hypothetical protein